MIQNFLTQLKRRAQEEDVQFDYDQEADVAYFSLGTPQPAVTCYLVDDAWVRYSPENEEIVGFTILDMQKVFLPHHQDLQPLVGPLLMEDVSREDQQTVLRESVLKLAGLVESVGWTPACLEEVPSPEDIIRSFESKKLSPLQRANRSVANFLQTMQRRLQGVWGRITAERPPMMHPARSRRPLGQFGRPAQRLAWVVAAIFVVGIVSVALMPTGGLELTGTAAGEGGEAGAIVTVMIILTLVLAAILVAIWLVSRRR